MSQESFNTPLESKDENIENPHVEIELSSQKEESKQIQDIRHLLGHGASIDIDTSVETSPFFWATIPLTRPERIDDDIGEDHDTPILTVEAAGTRDVTDQKEYQWGLTGKLMTPRGEVMLSELAPEGAIFGIELKEGADPVFNPDRRTVVLPSLSSLEDVIALLHEVGHGADFFEHPDKKLSGSTVDFIKSIERGEQLGIDTNEARAYIAEVSENERIAWARAFWMSRKHNLGIEHDILSTARDALSTYDLAISRLYVRSSSSEQFASSEQRGLMKSPEKIYESDALISLQLQTANAINRIYQYLDPAKPLEEFSFWDRRPEVNAVYEVHLDKDNQNEYSVTRRRIIDSQTKKIALDTCSLVGTRDAYVATLIQTPAEEKDGKIVYDTEIKMRDELNLLGVVREVEDVDVVKNNIKDIITPLATSEDMVIAAIRAQHPEYPEPYRFNTETGHAFSLEERIAQMKGT